MQSKLKHITDYSKKVFWFLGNTTVISAAICGASVLALMTAPLWVPVIALKQESEPKVDRH